MRYTYGTFYSWAAQRYQLNFGVGGVTFPITYYSLNLSFKINSLRYAQEIVLRCRDYIIIRDNTTSMSLSTEAAVRDIGRFSDDSSNIGGSITENFLCDDCGEEYRGFSFFSLHMKNEHRKEVDISKAKRAKQVVTIVAGHAKKDGGILR